MTPAEPTHAFTLDNAPGGERWLREAGNTGLTVSALGLGGAPLASMLDYDVPRDRAVTLVETVLNSPITVIDTSNNYNDGESESRIGEGVRAYEGSSRPLVVTKTDARDGDYSGERVRRSVQESMERLGADFLPLVHLHDPEFFEFDYMTEAGGAVDTLVALKAEGLIGTIGVAGGHAPTISRYVGLGVFDALLTHNRLTLVDRSAEALVADARARGMAVFNAGVFGGGILAAPRAGKTNYGYKPASPALLDTVAKLADIADEYGVELPAIALQASLREPLVDCTLVGMSRPERVRWTLDAVATPLPADLWERVDALLLPADQWIDTTP